MKKALVCLLICFLWACRKKSNPKNKSFLNNGTQIISSSQAVSLQNNLNEQFEIWILSGNLSMSSFQNKINQASKPGLEPKIQDILSNSSQIGSAQKISELIKNGESLIQKIKNFQTNLEISYAQESIDLSTFNFHNNQTNALTQYTNWILDILKSIGALAQISALETDLTENTLLTAGKIGRNGLPSLVKLKVFLENTKDNAGNNKNIYIELFLDGKSLYSTTINNYQQSSIDLTASLVLDYDNYKEKSKRILTLAIQEKNPDSEEILKQDLAFWIDPFSVYNTADLLAIQYLFTSNQQIGTTFALKNNINFTNPFEERSILGNFSGNLNGNYKTIGQINISNNEKYVGLIDTNKNSNSLIKNLGVHYKFLTSASSKKEGFSAFAKIFIGKIEGLNLVMDYLQLNGGNFGALAYYTDGKILEGLENIAIHAKVIQNTLGEKATLSVYDFSGAKTTKNILIVNEENNICIGSLVSTRNAFSNFSYHIPSENSNLACGNMEKSVLIKKADQKNTAAYSINNLKTDWVFSGLGGWPLLKF